MTTDRTVKAWSAEDDAAIRALHARYILAADESRAREWAECFTSDGVFADPKWGTYETRGVLEEFVGGYHQSLKETGTIPRHIVTNINFEVDGDTAKGSCYLIIYMTTNGVTELKTIGGYRDTVSNVDGQWLFARREVFYDN